MNILRVSGQPSPSDRDPEFIGRHPVEGCQASCGPSGRDLG